MNERNNPINIKISDVDAVTAINTLMAVKGFAMNNFIDEASRRDAKNKIDRLIDIFEVEGGEAKIDLEDGYSVTLSVSLDEQRYNVIISVPRTYYDFFCGSISFYR